MDYLLKGHPYVKSGIDIACWDILGKATGVCKGRGGSYMDTLAAAVCGLGTDHQRKVASTQIGFRCCLDP